jgi:hypothetical protein
MFANTAVYVGPLADTLGGVDVSSVVAAVVGGAVYWLLVRLIPEPTVATSVGTAEQVTD